MTRPVPGHRMLGPASTESSADRIGRSVKHLEQRGLVQRARQADDGRVVLVNLTEAGSVMLEDFRSRVHAMLGTCLAEIPDEQVDALAAATDALTQLIALLRDSAERSCLRERRVRRWVRGH